MFFGPDLHPQATLPYIFSADFVGAVMARHPIFDVLCVTDVKLAY